MSSFSKKVIINAAELDRLQQSQIQNFLPELHSIAQLHNQMIDIIGNKALFSDQKLNLLSNYQGRFDKLKKKTCVCVGAHNEPDAKEDEREPIQQVLVPQNNVEQPVSIIDKLGIQPMYRNKAIKLLSKIEKNPTILTYNKDKQVIIKGEQLPGSDFESLFKSMISPNPNLDQVKTDKFMGALHEKLALRRPNSVRKLSKIDSQRVLTSRMPNLMTAQLNLKLQLSNAHRFEYRRRSRSRKKERDLSEKTHTPPVTCPNILYVY